ncbi:MAG: hypothetical protein WA919_02325 [Coleofasciculaceae cyanobacterium]
MTQLHPEHRRGLERVAYYFSIPYFGRTDEAIATDIANHRAFDGQNMTVERVLADIQKGAKPEGVEVELDQDGLDEEWEVIS